MNGACLCIDMTETGISVYPDQRPLEEIKAYIKLAGRYGVKYVFSSMFSVEGETQDVLDLFHALDDCTHEAGMKTILDVNHAFLKKVNASPEDLSVFSSIGADCLRMDIPYGNEQDKVLCQNPQGIQISFNASFGLDHIENLVRSGVDPKDILMCHNFYPQRYTGMKWKTFLETNRRLKKDGFPVCAFASSHNEPTHGVWDAKDGLCTVEMMRQEALDLQARLLEAGGCDVVTIGNAYASEEELAALQQAVAPVGDQSNNPVAAMMKKLGNSDDIVLPRAHRIRVLTDDDLCDVEKEILFDFFPHMDVGDSSEWIWRSRMPRFLYAKKNIPARIHKGEMFMPGDVVMVNNSYAHYQGELQIVLMPIVNDGTRNHIGHIREEEMKILQVMDERDALIFIQEKEERQ
ncbi:MAG: MupG family TIM beta-alpha barrel fold protein [Bulleidia sp.]|nr:MupG family TIM beta-alpha barrel fold protein [Bulleidia sp.]